MTPESEALLLEYLRKQRDDDVIGALHKMADQINALDARFVRSNAQCEGEIRGISLRVGILEKAGEKLERKVERESEKSGSWQLEELQRSRESWTWLRRNWLALAAVAIGIAHTIKTWAAGK